MAHLGAVEYHLVSDGIAWSDGGATFGVVPRSVWARKLPPDEANRIPLALNCLLLRVNNRTILVDTGLGNKLTAKQVALFGLERAGGDLVQNLRAIGVEPADVDIVINTHLHADHCGGNTYLHPETKQVIPTFPHAEYWIQRQELAAASYPNERTSATYFAENFAILAETGQLKVISGDTNVGHGIRTVITRGHTQAHQSILIESEGSLGFYLADLASTRFAWERTAWVSAYDVEPLETIETKRAWQHWAAETQATILFEHDASLTAATLQRHGRHFAVEPLPQS